jgi:hypothetical protein
VTHSQTNVIRLPDDTAADWMQPAFDDSAWARQRGPLLYGSKDEEWKLIMLRGRFELADPAQTGDLSLDLAFRGGAVVYLNGKEVARSHMARGQLDLHAAAEPYPDEVYYDGAGQRLFGNERDAANMARLEKRQRRLEGCKLPAASLRRGVNLLAVAIHRAPTLARSYRTPEGKSLHQDAYWAKIGLAGLRLAAPPGAAAAVMAGPAEGAGFALWNHSLAQRVGAADYPDPATALQPVRIAAVRNGVFSGQVVAGADRPIKGLRAAASPLTGPATLPASAVRILYPLPDGNEGSFDSLEEDAPLEVAPRGPGGRAVQPLWIAVTVPPGAAPGDYEGTVTVGAESVTPVKVPLRVRVAEWQLPPPVEFAGCMDIIQSPESVAMAYDVPLWSDEHFKLLDRSFALLGALGNKSLFISCIRRTHFGNEHAMVRWVRDDEGELRPDFTVAERYLDTAMKHMGKIPNVILLCWEPPYSQGHAHGAGTASRTYDKTILYSQYDPETGEYAACQGPSWNTVESKAFWKKLTDGIQPVLARRGLTDALRFGLVGDARPTQQAMDDICNALPTAKWAVHSHYYVDKWKGYEMAMIIALWGVKYSPMDPERGYSFGWTNPDWLYYYPREMSLGSTLTEYRSKQEAYLGAKRGTNPLDKGVGPRGLGRLGGDFWPVLKDARGKTIGTLAGRYPESAWGQLNLNFGVPRLLGMGRRGPVPTIRSESFREALQEIEARVYIEKALLDDAAPALLGAALIGRCRATLDERIRIVNRASSYRGAREAEAWFVSSGWRERAERLFSLAAEVQSRYGAKAPAPNLAPPPAPAK